jgi:uncharacterized membrane protein
MKNTKTILSVAVLVILYGVGFFGTIAGLDLMHYTPLTLLISAAVVFASHKAADARFLVYALIVCICGFLLEWAGESTGRIFGYYIYGNNLGFKLMDIPVIIGINWLILSYTSSVVAAKLLSVTAPSLQSSNIAGPAIAALLMVIADAFLEQVAPRHDFWYWKNQVVPLQNYTAWFIFAFAFNHLFKRLEVNTNNTVAIWLYGLLLAFFAGLAIL